jgi:nickel-dependent lactate racemase
MRVHLHGEGYSNRCLTVQEISDICKQAFSVNRLYGKRILFIIPDQTRSGPLDIMFRSIYELLHDNVQTLDFLIALGTHPPMSEEMILNRVGITAEEKIKHYSQARFFNHAWKNKEHLIHIGTLSGKTVEAISNGMMRQPVEIKINKMVLDYDLLFIIGPTFPHEVVGFSGGNKYLFPGIAGQEIIDMFHWLGALITNAAIIGEKYTPVRRIVDMAAAMVPVDRFCASMVVKEGGLAGLYLGSPEEAWDKAADLSEKSHIVYKSKPFRRVLSCAPPMYDELWTGGKCMYKLEPVVADGGELIIYAPHLDKISVTHGELIRKIGYHVRDYFVKQMTHFEDIPPGVMAHSTHVKGLGTFENGVEKPRINVTLATGIPKEICKEINLGYRDPNTIKPKKWQNLEEEGILYVPGAGEMLYRLNSNRP